MTMYISKAKAQQLVGSGVSMASVTKTANKLKAVTASIEDKNHNQAVDEFELAAAVKAAGLGAKAKTAMWSTMGRAESDNTNEDGIRAPVTRSDLKAGIASSKQELAGYAKGGQLTVDGLKGQSLTNEAVRLLAAAKVAR